jgi:ATP-dependent exoDNAse (exonuclease V) alpha subunit
MPFRLAYALTIHKAQGQTLSQAIIDLGSIEYTLGLTYVALSRLRHFNDFLIMPFPLERLEKLSSSKSLQPRLLEEARMNVIIDNTYCKFFNLLSN